MKTNSGEAATAPKNSRKRKMKQVAESAREPPPPRPSAANLLTLQRQQFPPHVSTALHLNINSHIGQPSRATTSHIGGGQPLSVPPMQSQGIHIATSSLQPTQSQVLMELSKPVTSFTDLLTEDDGKGDINFIIKTHIDQMMYTLSEMSWKHYSKLVLSAEERAAKRLKEKEMRVNQMMIKNAELQQLVEQSKQEAQAAQAKVNSLENAVVSLKVSLKEANARGGGGGNNDNNTNAGAAGGLHQEDAESSFTDPSRAVEPIRLACKGCDKKVANMMLWPCHHVALCTMCDARARVCPVCSRAKMMSIELGLP